MTVANRRLIGIAAVLTLLLIAGILRFSGLGVRDFWFDESCSHIYVANLYDWPVDSNLLTESTNLPYYILLRGWVDTFGDTETSYRALSALAATLTVGLLAICAYRVGGTMCGLVCLILLAFHPLHLYYAHEARAYALWLLMLSTLTLLLVEAVRRRGSTWWIAYSLTLLVCLPTHYATMYWVPASAAVVFLSTRPREAFKRWCIATCCACAAFFPYFLIAVWPASRGGGSAWIETAFDPLSAIPKSIWAMLPAGGYPSHLRGLSILSSDTVTTQPALLVGISRTLPAVILVGCAALFVLMRQGRKGHVNESSTIVRTLCVFSTLALGPLVCSWLYSILVRPNYLVGRYDLVAWPGLMIAIALLIVGAARIFPVLPFRRHRRSRDIEPWESARAKARRSEPRNGNFSNYSNAVAIALCLLLAACGLVPIQRMAALRPGASFHRARADALAPQVGENDLVVALSYDRDYLLYYLHRARFTGRIVSFPSWLDRQIGWVDTRADVSPGKADELERDARALAEEVKGVIDGGSRVWLLRDSLDPEGIGPRGPVHRLLIDTLRKSGLALEDDDASLGLVSIRRR